MTEYYINKRTKETSTDDRYYGQPGWLVCTQEEYEDAKRESELAALRAERDELREALERYIKEHDTNIHEEGVDAGMSFPPDECDCSNCITARAILRKYEPTS